MHIKIILKHLKKYIKYYFILVLLMILIFIDNGLIDLVKAKITHNKILNEKQKLSEINKKNKEFLNMLKTDSVLWKKIGRNKYNLQKKNEKYLVQKNNPKNKGE